MTASRESSPRYQCPDCRFHYTRYLSRPLRSCDQLASSRYILDELVRHLLGKFSFSKKDSLGAASLVRERAELVSDARVELELEIDPDDLPILGAAVGGSCHCLETGDKELLAPGCVHDVPILAPSKFWRFEDEHLPEVD